MLLFFCQAPVNYVSLHCVKPGLRPLSMAISTVSIHIFGDVPSSPLVGIVQVCLQSSHNSVLRNWRIVVIFDSGVLLLLVFGKAASDIIMLAARE